MSPEPNHESLLGNRLLDDFFNRGCGQCNNTGYRGRLGICEIMVLDDQMREMIMRHESTNLLRNAAKQRGMRSLRESGLAGIYEGLTTIEEVVKQTITEE